MSSHNKGTRYYGTILTSRKQKVQGRSIVPIVMKLLIALAFILSLARAEELPVTISEVSIVEGPPLSFEFTITGPFFDEHKMERLTIRGIPHELARDYKSYLNPEVVRSPIGPEHLAMAFRYGSNRLEFYRDGELVHAGDGGGMTSYLSEVCIDPGSGRLRLMFNLWSGSASIPGRDDIFYFVPGKGIVSKTLAWHEYRVTTIDCAEDETRWEEGAPPWEWGESFRPCRCAGRIDGEDYFSAASEIISAETIENPISEADFSSLLSRIGGWEKVLDRFEGTAVDVQRFESSKFEVVAITYEDSLRAFGSSQTIFVHRVGDGYWVRVYAAPETSKGFLKATIHGLVNEDVLDLTMNVDETPYWGRFERVTKNLREWWQEADRARQP